MARRTAMVPATVTVAVTVASTLRSFNKREGSELFTHSFGERKILFSNKNEFQIIFDSLKFNKRGSLYVSLGGRGKLRK